MLPASLQTLTFLCGVLGFFGADGKNEKNEYHGIPHQRYSRYRNDHIFTFAPSVPKKEYKTGTFIVNKKLFWGQDRLDYALDEYNS